ncbi:hypothetical protein AB4148_00700 [Vibrio sp. 10N.286.51.F4]|uniref:hypothetical protein n=1 Tax=Vibrio sp. 10N.286.51.F4 TaxID=3229710 RepID=UPI00354B7807
MRVKLLGIVAWSPDPDGVGGAWYDIPKDSYVVGVYQNGGYYVATQNESPVHHVHHDLMNSPYSGERW